MKVYVLKAHWSTPDGDGDGILGVYAMNNFYKAYMDMMEDVSGVKSRYPSDIWQEDYTWENETSVSIGFDPEEYLNQGTFYIWEIDSFDVQ